MGLAMESGLDTILMPSPLPRLMKSTSPIHGSVKAGDTGVVAISKAEAYAEGDYPLAVAISDDVNVEIFGNVKAQGTGVFAGSFAEASVGEAGCPEDSCFEEQGNVTVAVKKGTVSGGAGYYGVVVKGGDDNLIEVGKKGTITSNSFMAILGGDGRRDGRELWRGCRRCRPRWRLECLQQQ